MSARAGLCRPGRCVVWAALALLLLPGCMGDGDTVRTATSVPASPTAPPIVTQKPLPSLPVPVLTPTGVPSPAATATRGDTPPAATREPRPIPAGQEEDLPVVALAYDLTATLRDVESGIVDAVSLTTITNRESAPLEQLYFRVAPAEFNAFSLNSLTRDDTAVDAAGSDNGTTLEVPLDPPLEPGATTELRFDFAIALYDTGDGLVSIGRDGDVLRLGYWYPMLSNDDGYPPLLDPPYTLTADYRASFTAPEGVVVAASGELTGPPAAVDGGIRYIYTLDNGRDFALMLSTGYALDERTTASGIIVRQYTLDAEYGDSDASRVAIRDRAFAVAEEALTAYAANIGPYPWPALSLVEGGPGLGGGIEYSALALISYDSGGLDNLVAHEIAHMWFYAIIGTRTQADPWIDEGAATFLGNGIAGGDYAVSSDHGTINYVEPLGASVTDLSGYNGGQWIAAVYTQGGSFFADTYLAMGETPFWDALRDVYTTQRFGIVTPWELLTTLQSHTSTDLLPVYERYFAYEWLG